LYFQYKINAHSSCKYAQKFEPHARILKCRLHNHQVQDVLMTVHGELMSKFVLILHVLSLR